MVAGFNLVIENLLISTSVRAPCPHACSTFQSRNRESSYFNIELLNKAIDTMIEEFQSRNRESSYFNRAVAAVAADSHKVSIS